MSERYIQREGDLHRELVGLPPAESSSAAMQRELIGMLEQCLQCQMQTNRTVQHQAAQILSLQSAVRALEAGREAVVS